MQPTQTNPLNVPGPDDLPPSKDGDDQFAAIEAAGFASKNLDRDSKEKNHDRRERFRDHTFWGAILILWLLMIATAIAIISLAAHYLTTSSWLNDDQLEAVKTYVFSSAVVAAVGGFLKKYLD